MPKKDQSGEKDVPLRITKAGNSMIRRPLVNCSHYNLGAFGPPSAIRDKGMRIAGRGGKVAKKRAVVAIARQIAVTMLKLWKDPTMEYQAFPAVQSNAAT